MRALALLLLTSACVNYNLKDGKVVSPGGDDTGLDTASDSGGAVDQACPDWDFPS